MKKEDFVELGLDEEMAEKAAKASAEELEGFIPKSRFDTVNQAKKDAEEQVSTYETQLKDLKESVKGNEELEDRIQELQDKNEKDSKKYKEQLEDLKIDTAIDLAFGDLPEAKRKAAKAFVDRSKLGLNDDGDVVGLDDQVKNIKESEDTSFIYSDDSKNKKMKGVKPGEGNDEPSKEPSSLADAIRQNMKK